MMTLEFDYDHVCDGKCGMYADVPHKCPKDPDRTCNCCEDCVQNCIDEIENEENDN